MSYSNNLRIELITTGTQAGVWGTTTNTNLGTIIEDSIAGYATVSVIAASQAFTIVDGAADQARNAMIRLTTTTGANFAVYAPPVSKQYVIQNDSSYTATIYNSTIAGNTTAAGAGVAIPAGKTMTVWSNGTDFIVQNSHIIGTVVGNVTGNLTGNVTGNVTGNADTATTLVANAAITTPVITGTKEVRVTMGANNVDLATGNYFSKTISGTTTFTVSNVPASGTSAAFILDLTNGGSASITWFTNTRWPGGIAPILSTSGRDILGFFTYDGGANWNGLLLGVNMS
jgi:hypothetical protein